MFQRKSLPCLAVFSLISLALSADEPTSAESGPDSSAQAASVAASAAGVQVFIDEQTGEVRSPTEAETAAMAEAFRNRYIESFPDKPVVYRPDGSISQELGTGHRLYTVARLSADGELETQCLPPEKADVFLKRDDAIAAEPTVKE